MGIATGQAETRDGDYFGAVLNLTARLTSVARGGQVLIDGTTEDLLTGVDLISLGRHRLRDIAKPIDIHQFKLRDCASSSILQGPWSCLGIYARRDQLRGPRVRTRRLRGTLRTKRLVTLTGVGGVGKTRLALELAARVVDDFPDGAWLIELAPVGEPGAVPDAVAAALGITQQPGKSVAESVAAALEGRSRLLIFDNCEHVLDAASEMIEVILQQSASVKVLTTSREGLRAKDEQLCPVPPLDVESAAASLFVERARAVAPAISFATGGEVVVEICRQLDGIPLAIELAASRMQSMTVAEIRDRLDDRFRLLVGSRRGLERHQTLRHAVQWSYDLLDDAEKSLLKRSSVFAGGFDLASACAVAGGGDEFATLDLLDAMVRKSLVTTDQSTGRTRFSMLETIRQFAEEQLAASGESDEIRTLHARYLASREDDVMKQWDSPRQRDAYDWFNVELANLRNAFRWSADHDDLDTAAAIAIYAPFLGFWIGQHEAIAWAEELIEPAKAVEHRRLAHLYTMAAQCQMTGRLAECLNYSKAGRAAIATGRYDELEERFEASLGSGYLTAGQPKRAIELCRSLIDRGPGPHTYSQLCLVLALIMSGAKVEAVAASQGLLAAPEVTKNPSVAAYALHAYGWAHLDADPVAASEALHRGLKIARRRGSREMESGLAVMLARLAAARGETLDAFNFLSLAIRHYYDSGSFSYMSGPLAVLAAHFDRLGNYEAAATISGSATTPLTSAALPEITDAIAHLRYVLGDAAYESFARTGQEMTNGAMAAYALNQIDLAQAELS